MESKYVIRRHGLGHSALPEASQVIHRLSQAVSDVLPMQSPVSIRYRALV